MPNVKIEMWEGRPIEVKKQLVKKITEVICEVLNCPPQAVNIVIYDIPKHNWGQDGELASEKFK
jgi:4-oxalocrotonate tautomerase